MGGGYPAGATVIISEGAAKPQFGFPTNGLRVVREMEPNRR